MRISAAAPTRRMPCHDSELAPETPRSPVSLAKFPVSRELEWKWARQHLRRPRGSLARTADISPWPELQLLDLFYAPGETVNLPGRRLTTHCRCRAPRRRSVVARPQSRNATVILNRLRDVGKLNLRLSACVREDGGARASTASGRWSSTHQAKLTLLFRGNSRTRFPVRAKIALARAGAAGGTGGSPIPRTSPPSSNPLTMISGA